MSDVLILDSPVSSSLGGAHAKFRVGSGRVARYEQDVSTFVTHPLLMTDDDWVDLAALFPAGATVPMIELENDTVPHGWTIEARFGLVQMLGDNFEPAPDVEAVVLGRDDVPDILDLVARTKPGPFLDRTIELGTYLGIRREGRLIALAGERMHPDGFTEISAVCTDPAYRGEGLATRLMRAVAFGIVARQEIPFLHASASNVGAIALYKSIGFTARNEKVMTIVRTPA